MVIRENHDMMEREVRDGVPVSPWRVVDGDVIEVGDNATRARMDGDKGYYVNDNENGKQYAVLFNGIESPGEY